VTIVSHSKPVGLCLEVAADLEKLGISAEVTVTQYSCSFGINDLSKFIHVD
jgi:pyruvate/2-oxoglutarate/acetoin dehydrogenase E1 component